MQHLIAGYRRFRAQGWPARRSLLRDLAEQGQKPRAMVIACIDSRVDPTMIFDCAPGEILTVRNVANLVPPYAPDNAAHGTSAALEFGIRVLEVPDVIVLGHGLCGGVQSLLHGAPATAQDFVVPWMATANRARHTALACTDVAARQLVCEHEVIKVSLENLMTFPWVADRVASGGLTLHGAWFAIHSGELVVLQPDGTFSAVS